MYVLLKDKGPYKNFIVENQETKASVVIGRLNYDISTILEKADIDLSDMHKEWHQEISYETAKALIDTTFVTRTHKIKTNDNVGKVKTNNKEPKIGVEVDAFDLIFGV